LRRRGTQVGATIDLYTGGRAAVEFEAPPGRWPEHEMADRLSLVVAIPAIAMNAIEDSGAEWLRERLRRIAVILSSPDSEGPGVPEPEVIVVTSDGPGDLRITLRLLRSATGPSPSLGGHGVGVQSLALAAEAVALVGFDAAPADVRLAAALSLEGILAWFHDGTGHRPEAQAMAYALAYAVARFEGAGRPVPAALLTAVEE
jgi:hypothetical protein